MLTWKFFSTLVVLFAALVKICLDLNLTIEKNLIEKLMNNVELFRKLIFIFTLFQTALEFSKL